MFKKVIIVICVLFLGACNTSQKQLEEKLEVYRLAYQSILNTSIFKTESAYFSVNATFEAVDTSLNRFDIYIDQPRIAMYDVEALAVIEDGSLVISSEMMPSIGIFEDQEYNLIPYQVNSEKGFPRGLNLNALTDREGLQLKLMVTWKDYFRIQTFREFIVLTLGQGEFIPETIIEEPESVEESDEVIDEEAEHMEVLRHLLETEHEETT